MTRLSLEKLCLKKLYLALPLLAMLMPVGGVALAEPSILWSEQIDGGGQYIDRGTLLALDPDGSLIIGGQSAEATGGLDLFLRKVDRRTGAEIWSYRFDGYSGKDVLLQDVTWDSAGQMIVAGFIAACAG
ncbi:hypothetical protein CSB20_01940 [bacterium DOLZORAL124_64_63]|nr:MAG: hypothetical protein CSB20_01940 [bacterium DOLZORAL124_64_63]